MEIAYVLGLLLKNFKELLVQWTDNLRSLF